MKIIVRTKKKEKEDKDLVELKVPAGYIEKANGELIEQTPEEVQEELRRDGAIVETRTFTEMTNKELKANLDKFVEAVKIIKKKMINGVHYIEVAGVERPIIKKQAAEWIASATGMTVHTEVADKILDFENEFIYFSYKATASWGNRSITADGSANSKEENQRKKYEDDRKSKTVYDVINDVQAMARKRGKQKAILELIAFTDIFETNEDNPLANSREQQKTYSEFYRYFLELAPNAPSKKKLKNGKWKILTEKEKLSWQKEYVRTKYLQANLLDMGLPTYNWGKKDISAIIQNLNAWKKKALEELKKDTKEK